MRPRLFDLLYRDDRMYVLEISRASQSAPDADGLISTQLGGNQPTGAGSKQVWALVTRRNVPGYPPTRSDAFDSYSDAVDYYKTVVVTTPRVSLGERPPQPSPTLEEYVEWLKSEGLFDPLLNPKEKNIRP